MKRYRFLSMVLIISIMFSCVYFVPVAHAEGSTKAGKLSNNLDVKLGQYIYMGTYNSQPIKWRCVGFEKATGSGTPKID